MKLKTYLLPLALLWSCYPARSQQLCDSVKMGTPIASLPATEGANPYSSLGGPNQGSFDERLSCYWCPVWSWSGCGTPRCAAEQAKVYTLTGDYASGCDPDERSSGWCTVWVNDGKVVARQFHCLD